MTQNPLFAEPKRKIVLAGATGFIGSELQARYAKKGYDVRMISRRPGPISWDDPAAIAEALEGSALLVNLAGRSVNCRYNERNKRDILTSRAGLDAPARRGRDPDGDGTDPQEPLGSARTPAARRVRIPVPDAARSDGGHRALRRGA